MTQTKNNDSKNKGNTKKRISLALQGGGSHGAFTWGVLDAMLEHDDIEIEGVSGTSAGGMNAACVVQGLLRGGNQGARDLLKEYWTRLGEMGKNSPLQFLPMDKAVKHFTLQDNPFFHIMTAMSQFFSPYQLNPTNHHPLRDLVKELFDFDQLQKSKDQKLFLCATHVETGKLKIFKGEELHIDSMLASACVPQLFQAIEVDGEFYWDGGFIGNPAIYPLIYDCDSPNIAVIQIRRVRDHVIPKTMGAIQNRLGEITQNSCLTREMRAIDFITRLIDDGVIPKDKMKRLHMHLLRDDDFFSTIDRATGFSADPDFLAYLFDAGRRCGVKWLKENKQYLGVKSTANLESDFV